MRESSINMVNTILVSNSAELIKAMKSATGGENIVLKGGNYGDLNLWQGHTLNAIYTSPIKITSASHDNQAVFTGLRLNGVTNVTFSDVKFDYVSAVGEPTTTSKFNLLNTKNISILNSVFDGDTAKGLGTFEDGYGSGRGLTVRGSSNITLSGNEVHGFNRGFVTTESNNIKVMNNNLYDMSSDGLDFSAVKNVIVDSNKIHDFVRSPLSTSHPDMIQFWTNGTTTPSVNIAITNNFLDIGQGQKTQSIFMRNEMVDSYGAGASMYYQNINISNNVIRNAHGRGISVGETNGLKVSNNTVLQVETIQEGGTISAPAILLSDKSVNVVVTNNVIPVVGTLDGSYSTGWTVGNNFLAQIDNPNAANYIGKLFVDALDKTNATLADFQVIKGSVLDLSGAGAHSVAVASSTTLYGYVNAHQASGSNYDSLKQSFDATHIYNTAGKQVTAGASVIWDFGDGTKGTGLLASHKYSGSGEYTATATLKLVDNTIFKIDKTINVSASDILDTNFDAGIADRSTFANSGELFGTAKLVPTALGGNAIDLNTGYVKYDATAEFFNNSEYSLVADFKKDVGQEHSGGRLIYFGGSFVVTVAEDGLNLQMTTTAGVKTLKVGNLGIEDSDWHRVGLTFSGETGQVKLYLDGHQIASASGLNNAVQTGGKGADFYLGGPFGGSFSGQVDNLHLSNIALSEKAMTTGTLAQAHVDFGTLSAFDAVTDFVASRTLAPTTPVTAPLADFDSQALALLPHIAITDFMLV